MTRTRVIITGASGFIGYNIAKACLERKWHVCGIGHGCTTQDNDQDIKFWNESDIAIDSLLEIGVKPDIVIHCAGGSSVGLSVEDPDLDFHKTVSTTLNILEYIRIHAPSAKLVYPSSAAVYGQVNVIPITEDTKLSPVSPYGIHKKVAESLCQLYANQYNLSICIVRLFSVYGPGLRKQLLWDACQKLEKGDSTFFGTGDEIRDFLHVSDAVRLLLEAVIHASPLCPIVNGGSGEGVKIHVLLQAMANIIKPATALNFTTKPKPGDPNALVADIRKSIEWGWHPMIPLEQGIREYIDWCIACQ